MLPNTNNMKELIKALEAVGKGKEELRKQRRERAQKEALFATEKEKEFKPLTEALARSAPTPLSATPTPAPAATHAPTPLSAAPTPAPAPTHAPMHAPGLVHTPACKPQAKTIATSPFTSSKISLIYCKLPNSNKGEIFCNHYRSSKNNSNINITHQAVSFFNLYQPSGDNK
eukprot:TRINITY_DN3991_c0_g1_i2.p1 TRINITY_DN3991_c0_g1~~TRINITY_DN3991_c0_g1_i2.p1  ORF type:complete len:172 (-),score=39.97 TRINITY_DN3991_c0_g1_i2:240-755(-)